MNKGRPAILSESISIHLHYYTGLPANFSPYLFTDRGGLSAMPSIFL